MPAMRLFFVFCLAAWPLWAVAQSKDGRVEISEGFESAVVSLPEGWRSVSGEWRIESGALVADSMEGEAYLDLGDDAWKDYEFEADVAFLEVREPSRWLSMRFRISGDGGGPWSQFPVRQGATRDDGMEFAVKRADGQWSVRNRASSEKDFALGETHRLRVVVSGSHAQCYVDGRLLLETFMCLERDSGRVGFGASGCVARFDNVRVRLLPDSEKATPLGEPSFCEIVAHRGFSRIAPENTVASAKKAMEAGADGAECDVRRTKDGVVILMHDDSVDRTTDGEGKVTDLSHDELKKLDAGSWKASEYAREPVPTLEQLLEAHKDTGCQAVIEIKQEGISRDVVEMVRKTDMMGQVALIAFSGSVVKEIRELEPDMPCAWLCAEDLTGKSAQERAQWIASQAGSHGTDIVDVHFGMLSAEILAELHKMGIKVWAWTVNEPEVMTALMQWGIDSITTDCPDTVMKIRSELTGR